jgi:thermostable 8-oxoguanine DNA glycosylase
LKIYELDFYNEHIIKDILGKGLKTRSFFENIYRPDSSNAVTVDLWQIRWARKIGLLKTKSLTDKQYKRIENRVQKYAKRLNMRPHQFQAITWSYMRGNTY